MQLIIKARESGFDVRFIDPQNYNDAARMSQDLRQRYQGRETTLSLEESFRQFIRSSSLTQSRARGMLNTVHTLSRSTSRRGIISCMGFMYENFVFQAPYYYPDMIQAVVYDPEQVRKSLPRMSIFEKLIWKMTTIGHDFSFYRGPLTSCEMIYGVPSYQSFLDKINPLPEREIPADTTAITTILHQHYPTMRFNVDTRYMVSAELPLNAEQELSFDPYFPLIATKTAKQKNDILRFSCINLPENSAKIVSWHKKIS